jgi:hypothetical protein
MNWVDILVVVLLSLILLSLGFYFLRKKVKGQSLTGCDCASGKGQRIVKAYHAEKKKETTGTDSCPYCHK